MLSRPGSQVGPQHAATHAWGRRPAPSALAAPHGWLPGGGSRQGGPTEGLVSCLPGRNASALVHTGRQAALALKQGQAAAVPSLPLCVGTPPCSCGQTSGTRWASNLICVCTFPCFNRLASPLCNTPPLQLWADIRHVMGIRSFQILVAQGIVGSTPWQVSHG